MSRTFRLRPSNAAVWTKCAATVQLSEKYPDAADQAAADEGTAAHWVWHYAATHNEWPLVGSQAPNGVVVTDDMIDGGYTFLEVLQSWQVVPHLEEQVHEGAIHPDNGGTPDAWSYVPGLLRIGDYKFGFGFVEVFENAQLLDYAAELLVKVGIDGIMDQFTDVEFTIVQPRAYHREGQVRTWRTKASHLRAHFNQLRASAEAAMGPYPQAVTGKHCKHCNATRACEALQKRGYTAMDESRGASVFDLTPQQAGRELARMQSAADAMEARMMGLQEQIKSALAAGQSVPDWTMERGMGRVVWQEGKDMEVITLGALLGVNLKKPAQAVTPKQARAAGVDSAVISAYSEQRSGEMKLVPVDSGKYRKIFN